MINITASSVLTAIEGGRGRKDARESTLILIYTHRVFFIVTNQEIFLCRGAHRRGYVGHCLGSILINGMHSINNEALDSWVEKFLL